MKQATVNRKNHNNVELDCVGAAIRMVMKDIPSPMNSSFSLNYKQVNSLSTSSVSSNKKSVIPSSSESFITSSASLPPPTSKSALSTNYASAYTAGTGAASYYTHSSLTHSSDLLDDIFNGDSESEDDDDYYTVISSTIRSEYHSPLPMSVTSKAPPSGTAGTGVGGVQNHAVRSTFSSSFINNRNSVVNTTTPSAMTASAVATTYNNSSVPRVVNKITSSSIHPTKHTFQKSQNNKKFSLNTFDSICEESKNIKNDGATPISFEQSGCVDQNQPSPPSLNRKNNSSNLSLQTTNISITTTPDSINSSQHIIKAESSNSSAISNLSNESIINKNDSQSFAMMKQSQTNVSTTTSIESFHTAADDSYLDDIPSLTDHTASSISSGISDDNSNNLSSHNSPSFMGESEFWLDGTAFNTSAPSTAAVQTQNQQPKSFRFPQIISNGDEGFKNLDATSSMPLGSSNLKLAGEEIDTRAAALNKQQNMVLGLSHSLQSTNLEPTDGRNGLRSSSNSSDINVESWCSSQASNILKEHHHTKHVSSTSSSCTADTTIPVNISAYNQQPSTPRQKSHSDGGSSNLSLNDCFLSSPMTPLSIPPSLLTNSTRSSYITKEAAQFPSNGPTDSFCGTDSDPNMKSVINSAAINSSSLGAICSRQGHIRATGSVSSTGEILESSTYSLGDVSKRELYKKHRHSLSLSSSISSSGSAIFVCNSPHLTQRSTRQLNSRMSIAVLPSTTSNDHRSEHNKAIFSPVEANNKHHHSIMHRPSLDFLSKKSLYHFHARNASTVNANGFNVPVTYTPESHNHVNLTPETKVQSTSSKVKQVKDSLFSKSSKSMKSFKFTRADTLEKNSVSYSNTSTATSKPVSSSQPTDNISSNNQKKTGLLRIFSVKHRGNLNSIGSNGSSTSTRQRLASAFHKRNTETSVSLSNIQVHQQNQSVGDLASVSNQYKKPVNRKPVRKNSLPTIHLSTGAWEQDPLLEEYFKVDHSSSANETIEEGDEHNDELDVQFPNSKGHLRKSSGKLNLQQELQRKASISGMKSEKESTPEELDDRAAQLHSRRKELDGQIRELKKEITGLKTIIDKEIAEQEEAMRKKRQEEILSKVYSEVSGTTASGNTAINTTPSSPSPSTDSQVSATSSNSKVSVSTAATSSDGHISTSLHQAGVSESESKDLALLQRKALEKTLSEKLATLEATERECHNVGVLLSRACKRRRECGAGAAEFWVQSVTK